VAAGPVLSQLGPFNLLGNADRKTEISRATGKTSRFNQEPGVGGKLKNEKTQQDVARYVVLRIPPLVHL
jgi:hypothetical protein